MVGSRILSVFAILGLASVPTVTADIVRGDVVRGGDVVLICPSPPHTAAYTSRLEFKSYVEAGDAIAFDSVGNLYSVDGSIVLQSISPDLQHFQSVHMPDPAHAIAVDSAGYSYVIGQSGRLFVYSPGGILQRSVVLPNLPSDRFTISMDVTPNGCTLFYTGEGGSANRYDACAMLPLTPIASGQNFRAVRALSDGGVAAATDDHIYFYDGMGRLVYQLLASLDSPIKAIAFDIDPQFLWVATAQSIVRMRLSNHEVITRTAMRNPTSVAVFGEHRPDSSALPAQAPQKRRAAQH